MRLRVTYGRRQEFLRDFDQQLTRLGLLVRVEPPPGIELFAPTELTVCTPDGSALLPGQVVQAFAGAGVAVGIKREHLALLETLVESARRRGANEGAETKHEIVQAEPAVSPSSQPNNEVASADRATAQAPESASTTFHTALHGNKDERMRIMRGNQHAAQMVVLRNPHLGLDEVASIARMSTVSADVLKAIADRREWYQRPDIAAGLVRNPKTPVPIAIKMVDYLTDAELRQIAKTDSTRAPIQRAARKRLLAN